MEGVRHTFSKAERLCGKTAIARLMDDGRWGATTHLKYCFLKRENDENPVCRLLVSVPKKFYKRAVKRNLLKRRLRESYRLQKELLSVEGVDFMLFYNSPEIVESAVLKEEVADALRKISSKL